MGRRVIREEEAGEAGEIGSASSRARWDGRQSGGVRDKTREGPREGKKPRDSLAGHPQKQGLKTSKTREDKKDGRLDDAIQKNKFQ
jgi:hypothetical protein